VPDTAAAALFAANHRLSFFSFLRTLCFECKRARSAGSTPADFRNASAASSSFRLRSSFAALAARFSAFSSARACRSSSAASGGGAAAASSSESLTSICWFAPSAGWNRQRIYVTNANSHHCSTKLARRGLHTMV
jgi:hypothetical protein